MIEILNQKRDAVTQDHVKFLLIGWKIANTREVVHDKDI